MSELPNSGNGEDKQEKKGAKGGRFKRYLFHVQKGRKALLQSCQFNKGGGISGRHEEVAFYIYIYIYNQHLFYGHSLFPCQRHYEESREEKCMGGGVYTVEKGSHNYEIYIAVTCRPGMIGIIFI